MRSGTRRRGRVRRGVRPRAATAAAATARPLAAAAAAPRAVPKRAAARGCHSPRPRRSPAGRPAGPRRHRGSSRASRSPAARRGSRVSWRPAARPHGGRRWVRARRAERATKRWRRRCRRVARGSGASHSSPPPHPLAPQSSAPGWSEAEESALGRRQSARRRAVSARHPSGEGAPLAPRGLQPWSEGQVGLWGSVWPHGPLRAGGTFSTLTVPTRAQQGKPPHSAARAPRTPRPRAPPPPDRAAAPRARL